MKKKKVKPLMEKIDTQCQPNKLKKDIIHDMLSKGSSKRIFKVS